MDAGQLILWAVVFVLTVILELATAQIVSIWFAAGALAAFIASFFLPFEAQLIIFVLVSVLFLVATRPLLNKMKKSIKSIKCSTCPYYLGIVKCVVSPCTKCNVNKTGQIPFSGFGEKKQ